MALAPCAASIPDRPRSDSGHHRSGVTSRSERHWWLDHENVERVEFGLARDSQVFEEALRLVHEQYVGRGYMAPHPSGQRRSIYNAFPTTKVFVATTGSRVIGTVTLIQDSPIGLPMDDAYREELAGFRARRRRLAEVSALATDPAYRTSGLAILMRLMRMLGIYAAEVAHLDDLCITVNPRHVGFYRKCLHFERVGTQTSLRSVNGAPAVALRRDLGVVRDLIDQVRSSARGGDGLYDFFFSPENYRCVMDRLRHDLEGAPSVPARPGVADDDGREDPGQGRRTLPLCPGSSRRRGPPCSLESRSGTVGWRGTAHGHGGPSDGAAGEEPRPARRVGHLTPASAGRSNWPKAQRGV